MRILYVTTISNTVNAFLIPHIKMLIDEGHQVDVAFNLVQEVKKDLLELNVNIYQIPFNRSPLSIDNVHAYKELKKLVQNEKYDIVHTHTPVASAIVRLACKSIKETKVFYTAHGFHFHKGAPLLNWMIYYPLEKYLSRYTDTLITINKEDYERSKNSFYSNKIEYLPGVGIDLEKIHNVKVDKVQMRKELKIPSNAFIVMSVGELNKNKNHVAVIKALAEVKNPNMHYLICGEGNLRNYLSNIAIGLNLENNVHLMGFRSDVLEIYKIVNLFVFPSFREGLPVSVMEAMASELPLVVTDIRGNEDLVRDKTNGYKFKTKNIKELSNIIKYCLSNEDILKHISIKNKEDANKYSIQQIIKELKIIYKTEPS